MSKLAPRHFQKRKVRMKNSENKNSDLNNDNASLCDAQMLRKSWNIRFWSEFEADDKKFLFSFKISSRAISLSLSLSLSNQSRKAREGGGSPTRFTLHETTDIRTITFRMETGDFEAKSVSGRIKGRENRPHLFFFGGRGGAVQGGLKLGCPHIY